MVKLCSSVGNFPPSTSSLYLLNAFRRSGQRSAYFLTNLGVNRSKSPIISFVTSAWPSQYGPAPMPIVGIASLSVISFANLSGTHSRIIAKQPAFSRARAESRRSEERRGGKEG